MLWVAVWVALVVLALALFALLGRSLWRRGKALAGEWGRARELLADAAEAGRQVTFADQDPEPAVFTDPVTLRRAASGRPSRAAHRAAGRVDSRSLPTRRARST